MIAFLTIFPVGKVSDDLSEFGSVWFLSPLVGAFIGILAGMVAWMLLRVMPSLVVGPLTIGLIVLITGAHHLDGLLDFGDALMAHGTPERKFEVMHDKALGAGGFALGIFVPILTIASLVAINVNMVGQAIIVSELTAKLSMVSMTRFGRSAHEGTGSIVVKSMHEKKANAKLLVAFIISLAIAGFVLGMAGVAATLTSIASALVITGISNNQFKGISGDVLGATNEISRMISLLVILAAI